MDFTFLFLDGNVLINILCTERRCNVGSGLYTILIGLQGYHVVLIMGKLYAIR